MAELWKDFTEQLGNLAGKWTAYAAFGSFVLYLLGYLTLRFQLSTYGVATNLDIFDEKYLFAGCRFLVYLVSSVPTLNHRPGAVCYRLCALQAGADLYQSSSEVVGLRLVRDARPSSFAGSNPRRGVDPVRSAKVLRLWQCPFE